MIPNLTRIRDMQPAELRRPLTGDWTPVDADMPPMRHYRTPRGLLVATSLDVMDDGSRWLHVSVSRRDRLPSWNDLREVKDMFIGRQREAVQVLPADRDYVNLHKFCLHLWSPEP